jgi:hypothetical protein
MKAFDNCVGLGKLADDLHVSRYKIMQKIEELDAAGLIAVIAPDKYAGWLAGTCSVVFFWSTIDEHGLRGHYRIGKRAAEFIRMSIEKEG